MALLEWQDRFRTHVDPFDDHHQHLFFLLNQAYDNLEQGQLTERMGELLNELIDYTIYHFRAEEHWMKENQSPHYEKHLQEHARFIERISELHADFLCGKTKISLEVLSFMKNWIEQHILVSDEEYAQFYATSQ